MQSEGVDFLEFSFTGYVYSLGTFIHLEGAIVSCLLKGINDRSEEVDTVEPRTCCASCTQDMLCKLDCDLPTFPS